MKYADYNSLVIEWGVELIGWMEGVGVCPIKRINTTPQLRRLLVALNNGTCHWEQLPEDDWSKRKAAYKGRMDAGQGRQHAPRKDKGLSHKGKQPISNDIVNSDSSDKENLDTENLGTA